MNKENLIQEFEALVMEITNICLSKLEQSEASEINTILDEFQKTVAEKTPDIINKAISNNIEDRIILIESMAEISKKYANKLISNVK